MFRYLFSFVLVVCSPVVSAQNVNAIENDVEEVIVTADPLGAVDSHLLQPVEVLTEEALRRRNLGNIGETLANEPGVSSSDFGPGAGRPIIRGLGGSRVTILENGISSMDISTLSADHAVSTAPLLARQVEIFRGPATLLYGGGASGGLVNIVNDRILRYVPEGLEGAVSFDYDSVSDGLSAAASMNAGFKDIAVHIDAMLQDTDDYDIPGFAELEPDEPEAGTLENSSLKTDNLGIGASYAGKRGFVGFAFSRYASDYGVPGDHHHHHEEEEHHDDEEEHDDEHHDDDDEHHDDEEEHGAEEEEGGVRIDMMQSRYDLEAALDEPLPGLRQVRARWAYNDYEHDEVEGSGEVGTRFKNKELQGRIELLHESFGSAHWDGVIGIQYRDKDFSAVGEEAFVPPSRLDSIAVFLFEKGDFGPWHLEFGARYESQEAKTDSGEKVKHRSYSLSAGSEWSYQDGYQLGLSLTFSQRAPNLEELFANGTHVATGTFEIGDPNLDEESSTDINLSWHKTSGRLTVAANLFYNQVNKFIFLAEQDLNGDGVADRVEEDFDGDPAEILDADEDEESLLVQQTQNDADFWGFELEAVMRVMDDQRGVLDARLWSDYVHAERDNGTKLPRITPWRFGGGLNYVRGPWYASLDYIRTNRQSNTAPLETATAGYDLLNTYLAYSFKLEHADVSLFVRGSNLLNEDARRHTSFVKDLAPLPGRSGSIGLRAAF